MSGVKIYAPVLYCENYIYKVDMIECEDMWYVKQSDYDKLQADLKKAVEALEAIESREVPGDYYGLDNNSSLVLSIYATNILQELRGEK